MVKSEESFEYCKMVSLSDLSTYFGSHRPLSKMHFKLKASSNQNKYGLHIIVLCNFTSITRHANQKLGHIIFDTLRSAWL